MNLKRIVMLVFAVVIVVYILLWIPTDFNVSYLAMQIRLGNSEYNEPISVVLDGEIRKDIFFHKSFVGTLSFDGRNILDDYDDVDEIIIDLTEQESILGSGLMISQFGTPVTRSDWPWIGNVKFSEYMNSFVITLAEDGGWTEENGLIIVGPASTHNDALCIFDTMMEDARR